MSFDLVVLAIDPAADDPAVRGLAEACDRRHHPEGDLDERIAGFYEDLRARYPDFPPYASDSPWMCTPLDVGIDHVSMNLSWGERSNPAIELILDLTRRYGLTIFDPQDGEVTWPDDRARAWIPGSPR